MAQTGFGLAMREYGATVVVVLVLVERSHPYIRVGRVRKKQALRDLSLHTEPLCFSVGGAADDDDEPPATALDFARAPTLATMSTSIGESAELVRRISSNRAFLKLRAFPRARELRKQSSSSKTWYPSECGSGSR